MGQAGSLKYMFVADNSVSVFASFRPIPGKEQELHELLAWMVENTRMEPGCERYDLYRQRGSAASFHLFERYRSDEALAAHRAAQYYIEYRTRVEDLIQGPIDVVVLEAVDVTG